MESHECRTYVACDMGVSPFAGFWVTEMGAEVRVPPSRWRSPRTMAFVQEWVAAVIGLVGAGVGAGAAMWGAHRAARSNQEALAVQIRKEEERWQRDQRLAAYQALLDADHRVAEAAEVAIRHRDCPTTKMLAALRTASDMARRAAWLIEIPGPQEVVDAAKRLTDVHHTMWAYQPVRPQGLCQWTDVLQRHGEAQADFRRAARGALGDVDLDPSAGVLGDEAA